MAAVSLVFRAELRRRWRSWLILVVLTAVIGGLVLAAAAAGRRTATAFPRFVSAHGYDFLVFNIGPAPDVAHLPGVGSVTTARVHFNGNVECRCREGINDANLVFLDLPPEGLDRVTKLVAGRMPAPSSPYDVLASVNLEQAYGMHIGSVLRTRFYTSSQFQALVGGSNENPAGPSVAFHIVGIETAESEFPSGQAPSYDIYTSQAFARTVGRNAATGAQYFVRLRHGAADLPRFVAALNAEQPFFSQNQDSIATAVATSIHPQAVGWWVLAVLAGLAGLAVIGQALGRQSAVESAEYPTLTGLGLRRRDLVSLATARNVLVAFVGALGAVVVAFALSPLTPVGEARLAEPDTGFAFDPLVLLVGALATVVVVLILGVWPSVRASRLHIGDERAVDDHQSSIVARVAAAGAPPSAVIGLRHALERGRGTASVPVATALFGTALAVLALCATAVFGASLAHLTSTPELYGEDYQILFANNAASGGNPAPEIASLKRNPSITGIMFGTREEVSVNGASVFALAGQAVRGPLLLSKVNGRLPTADTDIALGTTTMHQVGAHVGSLVHVRVQEPTGGTRTSAFRVVGTASFPGQFGLGGLGTGAAFTSTGYTDAVCPSGPTQSECLRALKATQKKGGAVLAQAEPGPAGVTAINHLLNVYQNTATRPTTPTSLVNFGEAVNFPLILGVMLALFGIATLLHLLLVSVGRRRHEIGLLKALGLVRGQVGAAVCWQATTVAFVGIVIGVPLGIAVGQVVWRAFATNLGAVPVATVPVWLVAALAAGVLVTANLLAIGPALAAARPRTARQILRMP